MSGRGHLAFLLWLAFGTVGTLKAQSFATHQLSGAQTFVGSTPCDPFIHALLEIKSSDSCEFMKWELQIQRNKPNSFALVVFYGESKPNTNGFKEGGHQLELKGSYTVSPGNAGNPKTKIYRLQADRLKLPILLIEMDPDIFHFADNNKKLLVGNGGFSYILNRKNP